VQFAKILQKQKHRTNFLYFNIVYFCIFISMNFANFLHFPVLYRILFRI
jgi:hypothetical protein